MAKQLAFQQTGWNSGAIERDEWRSAPMTQAVNRSRNQFFSSSGLALNENCGISGRYYIELIQYPFYTRAVSDNSVQTTFGFVLVANVPLCEGFATQNRLICVRANSVTI